MTSKEPSAPLQSDATDLGALWTKAVEDYMKKTGKKMDHMKAQSLEGVMKATEKSMETFGGYRHKDDKIDKVRSAFGRHLEDVQKCVSGLAMVGEAAGAFPPAMPVGLVFAACGHLLASFAGVKADYDKVEAFFEHSGRFFERLSVLEGQASEGPLALAIVRVFSTQLSICGIVECMIKDKRFKQWLNALWNLEDKELAAAYAAMQASIEELGSTVGYSTYSAIKITQGKIGLINDEVNKLDENIRQFRSSLQQDVQQLYASNLSIEVKITDGFVTMQAKQDESYEVQLLVAEQTAQILKQMERYKAGQGQNQQDKRGQTAQNQRENAKGDVGDNKFQAVGRIKEYFEERPDDFPDFRGAITRNSSAHETLQQSSIEDTSSWLMNDPDYTSWLDGGKRLLCICGSDGVGKSHLAYSTVRRLQVQDASRTNTAYFYLKENVEYQQLANNAAACMAVQIAESNSRYAEQVASKIKQSTANDAVSAWDFFFVSLFPANSQSSDHLHLVLDGIDELDDKDQLAVVAFLSRLTDEKPRISVLLTCRSKDQFALKEMETAMIEVTKEKIEEDMRKLIKHRLKSLPRLKKFNPAVKQTILRKLMKQADSFSYAEHMLRRYSYVGRERKVIKDLMELPENLQDLYDLLLEECIRDRSVQQRDALMKLFAFLAFAKISVTLGEATAFVQYVSSEDTVDIEDEVIGRSARILEIDQLDALEDDLQDPVDDRLDEDTELPDEKEPEPPEYFGSMITFQERSLRQYFRVQDASRKEAYPRIPASVAHFMLFEMCVNIIMSSPESEQAKHSDPLEKLFWYGISCWHEHLVELRPESADNDTTAKVINLLHLIVTDAHQCIEKIEKYSTMGDIYPKKSDSTKIWYETIIPWTRKAQNLPTNCLDPKVRRWASDLDRTNLLRSLAQAHYNNWCNRTGDDKWSIFKSYEYAREALILSGCLIPKENDPKKAISDLLAVSDYFEHGEKAAITKTAIGTTIRELSWRVDDAEAREEVEKEGLMYLETSVELLDSKSLIKSSAYRELSDCYMYGRHSNDDLALGYLDKALSALPDPDTKGLSKDIQEKIQKQGLEIRLRKMNNLQMCNRIDEALAMFDEARVLAGDQQLDAWEYGNILRAFGKEIDPDGHRLIDTMKSWSIKERTRWLENCFRHSIPTDILKMIYSAAKRSHQVELVLGWFTAYERATLTRRGLDCFNVRSAIADIYLYVLEDVERAKQKRHEMLTMKINLLDYQTDISKRNITNEWMTQAGLIYSQFHDATDPARKQELLEEMKSIPRVHTSDDLAESNVGMLLANMLRVMGPAQEYRRYMERLFATCISDLEDSVAYNDAPSLRLLAKVCASVPGLERDAQIAYSAQYSILDPVIHEQDPKAEKRRRSLPFLRTDSELKEDSKTPIDSNVASEGAEDVSAVETQPEGPSMMSNTQEMNGDTNEDSDVPMKGADREVSSLGEETVKDLNKENLTASGTSEADICSICLNERKLRDSGEKTGWWKPFCGKDHKYLKGPIAGWEGVKGGRIRIKGEQEFDVKEWIRGLKEERWKAAWETYWIAAVGLKDIALEVDERDICEIWGPWVVYSDDAEEINGLVPSTLAHD